MKRIITAAVAAILLTAILTSGASAHYFDDQEAAKAAAHAAAEDARADGLPEDCDVIRDAQAAWWTAQMDIDRQLDLLTRVVYREAGANWLSDRQQQLVAAVVINRCADPRFPATIPEVVYQRGQYGCTGTLYTIAWYNIPQRCYDNARAAAYGQVECPVNVIFQSGVRQGRGTYAYMGNTYFCYG